MDYQYEIKPRSSLFEIKFKEIWRYRDLFYMYVKRDIITVYKQTILGPLWFFIQPILTTIMFMFVFGNIAGIATDGVPQALFYFSGLVMWNYFSACLNSNSNVFNANQGVFGKVYFPRLVVPLSVVTSNLIKFFIQFILFLGIYFYYIFFDDSFNVQVNYTAFLFPLLLFMLAGLGLGFGILFSSMTTKYRDLNFLLQFAVQLWMYATPIIYPLTNFPADKQWIILLNPVTSIIETFKYGFLGVGTFNWLYLLYSFGFMVVLFFVGIIVFNKVEKSFMDTV